MHPTDSPPTVAADPTPAACCGGDPVAASVPTQTAGSCCGGTTPDAATTAVTPTSPTSPRRRSWKDYLPLIVIVTLTLAAAVAKQANYPSTWDGMAWMHDFMGFFLVVFPMFKFFDLRGFADGFQKYDLLARRSRTYATIYPFLELALGLAYLSHVFPVLTYSATIILMSFGALGVLDALRKGLVLDCACMGTALKVPLTTVALIEDLGMAIMAAAMLFHVL